MPFPRPFPIPFVVISFLLLVFFGCSQNPHVDQSTPPSRPSAPAPALATASVPGDRDHDGVPDTADKCPDEAGPASNNGCPLEEDEDRDHDGVTDTDDRCPVEPGPASNDGCPLTSEDRDNDFVPDEFDRCPDQPGKVINDGCPVEPHSPLADDDHDGVINRDDRCPTEPGPAFNQGCPVRDRDSDHDGLPDSRDACPLVPGPACNGGCPVPKDEERRVLYDVRVSLKFEFDKATIRKESFPALNRLARFLLRYPRAHLKMVGHTDDVGSDAYNMALSEARVSSVREYLVYRGVADYRIATDSRGEREPLVSPYGLDGEELERARGRNRRVDMSVRYETREREGR